MDTRREKGLAAPRISAIRRKFSVSSAFREFALASEKQNLKSSSSPKKSSEFAEVKSRHYQGRPEALTGPPQLCKHLRLPHLPALKTLYLHGLWVGIGLAISVGGETERRRRVDIPCLPSAGNFPGRSKNPANP